MITSSALNCNTIAFVKAVTCTEAGYACLNPSASRLRLSPCLGLALEQCRLLPDPAQAHLKASHDKAQTHSDDEVPLQLSPQTHTPPASQITLVFLVGGHVSALTIAPCSLNRQ